MNRRGFFQWLSGALSLAIGVKALKPEQKPCSIPAFLEEECLTEDPFVPSTVTWRQTFGCGDGEHALYSWYYVQPGEYHLVNKLPEHNYTWGGQALRRITEEP